MPIDVYSIFNDAVRDGLARALLVVHPPPQHHRCPWRPELQGRARNRLNRSAERVHG
ncbi:hypothetical protein [Actinomadura madurae]|uniref:hypothetical protein n=1 Tax=Actinomadura madurae TaxID=1993 RepID=UPI0015EF4D82|nr:hypothetical protein [Actinomadura madurae]